MKTQPIIVALTVTVGSLVSAPAAMAGSHSWRFSEVFSNADRSIQFIELKECCGEAGEIYMTSLQVRSQATGNIFSFPEMLKGSTSNRYLLLATQSFANLPGAPAPDYIIPAGFFSPNGDTLRYHVYDEWVISPGQVPTNCVDSLHRARPIGPNSPINYQGGTGHVDACPCPGDIVPAGGGNGNVNVDDLLLVINSWGQCPIPCPPLGPPTCAADLAPAPNGNCTVNVDDLLAIINSWGLCP